MQYNCSLCITYRNTLFYSKHKKLIRMKNYKSKSSNNCPLDKGENIALGIGIFSKRKMSFCSEYFFTLSRVTCTLRISNIFLKFSLKNNFSSLLHKIMTHYIISNQGETLIYPQCNLMKFDSSLVSGSSKYIYIYIYIYIYFR